MPRRGLGETSASTHHHAISNPTSFSTTVRTSNHPTKASSSSQAESHGEGPATILVSWGGCSLWPLFRGFSPNRHQVIYLTLNTISRQKHSGCQRQVYNNNILDAPRLLSNTIRMKKKNLLGIILSYLPHNDCELCGLCTATGALFSSRISVWRVPNNSVK